MFSRKNLNELFGKPNGLPQWLSGKEPAYKAGIAVGASGLIPGQGRSPGAGTGNSLQYSCLGNPTHGQKSLAGYSSRRHKESDMTERTNTYIQQSFKLYLIQ